MGRESDFDDGETDTGFVFAKRAAFPPEQRLPTCPRNTWRVFTVHSMLNVRFFFFQINDYYNE